MVARLLFGIGIGLCFSSAALAQTTKPELRLKPTATQIALRLSPMYLVHDTVPVLERVVSLDLHAATVEEALKEIARRARVPFSFSRDIVPLDDPVSVVVRNVTVAAALGEVLAGKSLRLVVSPSGQVVIARDSEAAADEDVERVGMIMGRVTDAATGDGLEGASVILQGTSLGGLTGAGGRYSIQDVPDGTHTLTTAIIGYEQGSQEVTVRPAQATVVNFALERSAIALDEVVVTGSVVETKIRELPSPITTIGAQELRELPITRVDQLFRGYVPGAMVFDQGPYNYYSSIQMRGQNSLYFGFIKTYIDGVEVTNPLYIATIDPNSIERIEILRGPQASTIYGSEASGGVMQIFTKKGQETARPRLSIKTSAGIIQSDYSDEDVVIQQNHSISVFGGDEGFSYNIGGTYFSYGEYIPEAYTKNYSFFGGLKVTQGDLTAEITGRYYIKDFGWPLNPILREAGYTFWQKPRYEQDYIRQQTVGLNLSYVIGSNWTHNLILGYDRNLFEYYTYRERLTTPDDTLYSISYSPADKSSIRYNTSISFDVTPDLVSTITAGLDHYTYSGGGFYTGSANRPLGVIEATDVFPTHNLWGNTGYFVQTKVGMRDALFLTGGLRLEDNDNFGEEYGRALAPRVGAAYAFGLGDVDVKARGSWGKGIKAPDPGDKQGFTLGSAQYLPNPDIGPEEQVGWDAGIELYFGERGSFDVTYYDQTAINLIDNVEIGVTGDLRQYQYQNVGEIANKGWELQGTLNVSPFSLVGTFTTMSSKVQKLSPTYGGELQVGDALLEIPKYTMGATLTYGYSRGNVALSMTHMGSWMGTDWIALYGYYYGGDEFRGSRRDYWMEYDPFTKFNLTASYGFTPNLQGFINMKNLTDLQIAERSNTTITAGRITMFGLRYTY